MGCVPASLVRRSLVHIGLVVTAMVAPVMAHAQLSARRIEVFGTAGGIAGATPLHIDGSSRVALHGGLRLDAGIQGERLALGVGARVWSWHPRAPRGDTVSMGSSQASGA